MESAGAQPQWPSYVAAGPFLFFSGQMGRKSPGEAVVTRYRDAPNVGDRANTTFDWVADMEAPVGAQALAIYERYRTMLGEQGSDLGHLLRYHIYQRDKHFFSVFDRIRRTYEPQPPSVSAASSRKTARRSASIRSHFEARLKRHWARALCCRAPRNTSPRRRFRT